MYALITFFELAILIILAFMYVLNRNRRINSFTGVILFSVPFYLIAPIYQYQNRVAFWGRNFPADINFLLALALVVVFLAVYVLVYENFTPQIVNKERKLRKYPYLKLYIVTLICGLIVLDYYNYDPLNFIFRVAEGARFNSEGPLYLIVSKFIRPLPVVMWLLMKTVGENRIKMRDVPVILYLALILFPTGIPRFLAGTIYFSLIIVLFAHRVRAKKWLVFSFSSILVLFPILNRFRFQGTTQSKLSSNLFLSEDFDSFSSIYGVLDIGKITYGEQLLGSFFFWMPRSIWSSKPVGSGLLLADELNFTYSNVSMNFIGEGFLNFGIIGVVLFSVVLAIYTKIIDSRSKRRRELWSILFSFQLIFILRGDLMSSLAFTIALLIAYKVSKFFLLSENIC